MECKQVRMLLNELVDGILDEDSRSQVEEHLLHCRHCRAESQRLLRTVSALKAIETLSVPSDFLQNLWQRIDRFETSRRALVLTTLLAFVRQYRKQLISGALAFVLAFGGTVYYLKHLSQPERAGGETVAGEAGSLDEFVMKDIIHRVATPHDSIPVRFPTGDRSPDRGTRFNGYYVDEVRPVSVIPDEF